MELSIQSVQAISVHMGLTDLCTHSSVDGYHKTHDGVSEYTGTDGQPPTEADLDHRRGCRNVIRTVASGTGGYCGRDSPTSQFETAHASAIQ
jgi:hypothetical protein